MCGKLPFPRLRSNHVTHAFTLTDAYPAEATQEMEWTVQRTNALRAVCGRCRDNTTARIDSGEAEAIMHEDGSFAGLMELSRGGRFIYEGAPSELSKTDGILSGRIILIEV